MQALDKLDRLDMLEQGMRSCLQFKGQDMLAHGLAVHGTYLELVEAAGRGHYPAGWLQPKWWTAQSGSRLLALQPDPRTMQLYQTYHDCGKHLCRTVDEAGRQHFEGHAQASAAAWRAACGDKDPRGDIAWLIERDMLLHMGSNEECAQI